MRAFAGCFFGLILIVATLRADHDPVHVILIASNGDVRTASSELIGKAAPDGVDALWAWRDGGVPIRFNTEGWKEKSVVVATDSAVKPATLRIAIDRGGQKLDKDARVFVAPRAMWEEVPEEMLPSQPVPVEGSLIVPAAADAVMRARLIAGVRGSWWADAPVGQASIAILAVRSTTLDESVVDARGAVSGAFVTISDGVNETISRGVLCQFRADAKGRFAIPSVPDHRPVSVMVSDPLHAPLALNIALTDLPRSLRLQPGAVLRGRVTDRKGRALSGVTVEVETWLSDDTSMLFSKKTRTDEKGLWVIGSVPHRSAAITASLDGYARATVTRKIVADERIADLVMERGRTLVLVITDDRGALINGANAEGAGQTCTTKKNGLCTLNALSEGAGSITIKARDHIEKSLDPGTPFPARLNVRLMRAFLIHGRLVDRDHRPLDDASARITLGSAFRTENALSNGDVELALEPGIDAAVDFISPAAATLHIDVPPGAAGEHRDLGDLIMTRGVVATGRLVSALDQSPVGGARIWTPRASANGTIVSWATGDLLETTSAGDGSFTLRGLSEEPALLRIDGAGFARELLQISPDPSHRAQLGDVALRTGGRLRVIAGEKSEEPMTARVDLRGNWSSLDMLTAPVSEGAATFGHVPAGTVRVSVMRGRSIVCEKDATIADDDESEVKCESSPLTVHGQVLLGDASAGSGTVQWSRSDAAGPGIIMNHLSPAGVRQQQVYVDGPPVVTVTVTEAGTFSTDELRPGTWRVSWFPAGGGIGEPQKVEVPESRSDVVVNLRFPESMISGIVVDGEGKPVAGARVLELSGHAFATSGTDGDFILRAVTAGARRVQAREADLVSDVVAVTVEPGRATDPLRLMLHDTKESGVPITVISSDGASTAGAFVFVESSEGVSILTSDSSGTARVEFSSGMPVRLRAAAVANGRWTLGDWLDIDSARKGVRLDIGDCGALSIGSKLSRGALALNTRGWSVSMLLSRLGSVPFISAGNPLIVRGLPPGDYSADVGSAHETGAVKAGQVTFLTMP